MESIFNKPEQAAPRPQPIPVPKPLIRNSSTVGGAGAAVIIICWTITMLGVAAGTFVLFTGMATATGAPQEAVVCALAVALAVLPYCFARAVTEIVKVKL